MRNKRGKGSDQYRVLMQVDRETEKSFSKIPEETSAIQE